MTLAVFWLLEPAAFLLALPPRYNSCIVMSSPLSAAIAGLTSPDASVRIAAAAEIYRTGRRLADQAVFSWWRDAELSVLLGPEPVVTVGLAVERDTFAEIRAANDAPPLAQVPPDQDAEEFELHFPDGVSLDVLTTRAPGGQGAIARYLAKFREGIQQVEFRCAGVDRDPEGKLQRCAGLSADPSRSRRHPRQFLPSIGAGIRQSADRAI
jgi:hypothetical protein